MWKVAAARCASFLVIILSVFRAGGLNLQLPDMLSGSLGINDHSEIALEVCIGVAVKMWFIQHKSGNSVMLRRIFVGFLVQLAAAFFASFAAAQTPVQRGWCEGTIAATPNQIIEGCTAAINSGLGTGSGTGMPWAFNNRGNAYYHKKDYTSALADYGEAIRRKPSYATPYSGRGAIYDSTRKYDEALAELNKAIELDKTLVAGFLNRGDVYFHRQDYARALADFNQAVRLAPKFPSAYINRGHTKSKMGDKEGGEKDLLFGRTLLAWPNAHTIKGAGILIEGIDYRHSKGASKGAYNKEMYNKIYLRFLPIDNSVKVVDLKDNFAISGDYVPRTTTCSTSQGYPIFHTDGPNHVEYTCPTPKPHVLAGRSVPSLKSPTSVIVDTALTRDGNVYHFKGKISVAFSTDFGETIETTKSVATEEADLVIGDRSCKVLTYRRTETITEAYVGSSLYLPDLGPQPKIETKTTDSEAKCRAFQPLE